MRLTKMKIDIVNVFSKLEQLLKQNLNKKEKN